MGKRYKVHLSEEAQRQLEELPEYTQAEIRKTMNRIARNPYSSDRVETEGVTALRRASFELVFEWMKTKGITDRNQAREILDRLIELGLAEGDEEVGYILTEKGVVDAEKIVFGDVGVV